MMEQLNLYLFRRNDRVRRIKPNSKITVNYFQNRRWQLITLLERLSGFWPDQSKLQQYPLQLLHSFIIMTVFSAMANQFSECVDTDLINNMTLECFIFMIVFLAIFMKLIFGSMQQYHRRKVYEIIVKHFDKMNDPEEAAVLNEAAERGFKYTLYYICMISVLAATFDSVPALRAFYNYLFTHHELRVQLPAPMNYGFDHNKYWYIIVVDFLACACSSLLVLFTYDFSFVLQVRHAAALFKLVGIRLRKVSELPDEFDHEPVKDENADDSYSLISSAIDLHSECFELVKLIEKSYSICWLLVVLASTGSFGAIIHLISTKFHDPIDTIRYALAFMIVIMHFQVCFSQSQLIIDSAKSVSDACCECKWYALPTKSRKLLTMMMIRTSIPCQLTGAKLFPLSMESFSKMLKAGLSYYSVFKAQR